MHLVFLSVALSLAAQHATRPAPELQITNLYDAFGAKGPATRDFGFSALIRYGDLTILFDAGADADTFAHNLKVLGIEPRSIDIAVASHNHHDHISGFDHLLAVHPEVKLYLPHDFALGGPIGFKFTGREPEVVAELPVEQRYFGGQEPPTHIRTSGRFWDAQVEFVGSPTEIAPGVHLVPTRSELLGTFSRYPPHEGEPRLQPMPELSLSLATPEGQVLIVGCSHAGVETIVAAARRQVGGPVHTLAGGYHLLPYDRAQVSAVARRLRAAGVKQVAPSHCSGHLAFHILRETYGDDYRFFGLGTTFTP